MEESIKLLIEIAGTIVIVSVIYYVFFRLGYGWKQYAEDYKK